MGYIVHYRNNINEHSKNTKDELSTENQQQELLIRVPGNGNFFLM